MLKFSVATLVCTWGLVITAHSAQAGCCHRTRSCGCQPVATCCPPAPTCAAPAPSHAPAAPMYDAAPPAPTAAVLPPAPGLAQAGNNAEGQSYRSFSYDTAPTAAPVYTAPTRIRGPVSDSLKYRADRKILGNY